MSYVNLNKASITARTRVQKARPWHTSPSRVQAQPISSSPRSQESTTKSRQAMARQTSVIPPSLSPHICIISSPDLVDLLSSLSLPPLPQILQSFSPLPQGKTRFIRGTNTSDSHMQLLSHNEDNILDTSASHLFRFTLLRLGRGRRRVS